MHNIITTILAGTALCLAVLAYQKSVTRACIVRVTIPDKIIGKCPRCNTPVTTYLRDSTYGETYYDTIKR